MSDFEVTQGIRHHRREVCSALLPWREGPNDFCPFHRPSLHPMVEEPMLLRETGLIERTCRHGVGHPDPDSARWLSEHGPEGSRGTWGVHGCDGCCRLPERDGAA